MICDKRDIVILLLSVQLVIMGISLTHAYHVIGYLEGQLHVQQELDKAAEEASGPYTGVKAWVLK